MIEVTRSEFNPILQSDPQHHWEAEAVFNGSVVCHHGLFYLLYRAQSAYQKYHNVDLSLSTIGCAESRDGISFSNRRQLIKPEKEWEEYGCEDPRITKLDDKFYIFYTAIGGYPASAKNIRVGLAIARTFQAIEDIHLFTPFNANAMALFPAKIKLKIAAILTINTDRPPAKIAIRLVDKIEDLWDHEKWQAWLLSVAQYEIPLRKTPADHVEVGAAPILTRYGWLVIYSYITNYFTSLSQFTVEAVLLDKYNPYTVIGRTNQPLLVPQMEYELKGKVPNIVFPSGAVVKNDSLWIYYGGADKVCALAKTPLTPLINQMTSQPKLVTFFNPKGKIRLKRYSRNPILKPRDGLSWEAGGVFNTAALYAGGNVHLVYRAFSDDKTSTLGYACSHDGFKIDERPEKPIYVPREDFEKKAETGVWSGCEDPRLTLINNRLFMCYTAYDGMNPTRVALSSILLNNFLSRKWYWEKPTLISPLDMHDKNACILPQKVNGKFVIFHRIDPCIWVDFVDRLDFTGQQSIKGSCCFQPRPDSWDSKKIGIGATPIKTEDGWLLIYHGVSEKDKKYRLGIMLLDLHDPTWILARPDYPILEPMQEYEKEIVFTCGAVVRGQTLFVYYGAADIFIGVATIDLRLVLKQLKHRS